MDESTAEGLAQLPDRYQRFLAFVAEEITQTPPQAIHSGHESYALLLESLESFWNEVKYPPETRPPGALLVELIHLATLAAESAVELGLISDIALTIEGSY